MAARHYAQIFDATLGDQSATDDLRFASTPLPIRGGKFRLHYIPFEGSGYDDARFLLAVPTGVNRELKFYLGPVGVDSGQSEIIVEHTDNGLHAVRTPLTFAAKQELTFVFDAAEATIEVIGATTSGAPGVSSAPWSYVATAPFRLGGSTVAGYETAIARGYVSLPYAVL